MLNIETNEKLSKIKKLLKEKEEIEKRIEALINQEEKVILPDSFSMMEEVLRILSENMSGLSIKNMVRILRNNYPTYNIKRFQVASSLNYLLHKKKKIIKEKRGFYKLK